MPKILVRKQKKEFVKDLGKEVVISKPMKYYVRNLNQDVQTRLGIIPKSELKKKAGSVVKTKTDKEFVIIEPDFIDKLKHIKRLPQTMPLKDMGLILAETGASKDSLVVDCGTGSGALACFLAHHCKKVVTYEIRKEHQDVAKENAEELGLKNITFKLKNPEQGISEKNIDLITLDVPEPWKLVDNIAKALKIGGYAAAYTISATQLQEFVNTVLQRKEFILVKSCELIERLWKIEGKIVRPKIIPLGHSGFLTIIRRIR